LLLLLPPFLLLPRLVDCCLIVVVAIAVSITVTITVTIATVSFAATFS